jgi:predicted transposase YbfD/YdcC
LRLTLDPIPVADKSNEIPARPARLRQLKPRPGTLITADALHWQQESARLITQEWGGDYLFGLKGNQNGVLDQATRRLAQQAFSPLAQAKWEKGHGQLERRRVVRVAVSPEEIGLCGGWQVIAVQSESLDLTTPAAEPTVEVRSYATSLSGDEPDDAAIVEIIRGHWSAIENGTHYRRDVTFGEDACRTAPRGGAEVLATLRNLANGIYEWERERGRTAVDTLRSWLQQQTCGTAWALVRR